MPLKPSRVHPAVWVVAITLCLLGGAAAMLLPMPVGDGAEPFLRPEVKWVRGLPAGLAEAKRTGKPMMVVVRCER